MPPVNVAGPTAAARGFGEDTQRAVILWRGGVETLVIGASYHGTATALAWVVPVPSVPAREGVFLAKREFLDRAFEVTAPDRYREIVEVPARGTGDIQTLALLLPFGGGPRLGPKKPAAPPPPGATPVVSPVAVHDLFALGPYEIAILGARQGADLVAWLREHGFEVPAGLGEVADDYIRRGWAFVAARSAPGEAGAAAGATLAELPPLGFRLAASQPTYPLRISRLTARGRMGLRLAIFADGPVKCAELPELAWTNRSVTGGTFDTERRAVAMRSTPDALLCEARGRWAWLEPDSRGRAASRFLYPWTTEPRPLPDPGDGQPPPDVAKQWVTRYWGLLQGDRLTDLTFVPSPEAPETLLNERCASVVAMPWWQMLILAGPAVLAMWLATFILVPILGGAIAQVDADWAARRPTYGLSALYSLLAVAGLAYISITIRGLMAHPEHTDALATPLLMTLFLYGLFAPLVGPFLVAWRIGSPQGNTIATVAGLGILAVTVLVAAAPGRPHDAGASLIWVQLGIACTLAAVLLPRSPKTLAARPHRIWPVAASFGLLFGVVIGMAQAHITPEWKPETVYETNRGAILAAMNHFRQDYGCLPASLADLTFLATPSSGVDCSGNPVQLTAGTPWKGPYLPHVPFDPTTWRRDTWLYEPTGDMLVEPGRAACSLNIGSPPAKR